MIASQQLEPLGHGLPLLICSTSCGQTLIQIHKSSYQKHRFRQMFLVEKEIRKLVCIDNQTH